MNITVNGKSVSFKITLGGMKEFKEETGLNFLSLDSNDIDPEVMSQIIYLFSKKSGSDITMDDVDSMGIEELVKAGEAIKKSSSSNTSGSKGGKK